eukprot:scaffold2273_cov209-Alexandrium_tamarense.AAC.4
MPRLSFSHIPNFSRTKRAIVHFKLLVHSLFRVSLIPTLGYTEGLPREVREKFKYAASTSNASIRTTTECNRTTLIATSQSAAKSIPRSTTISNRLASRKTASRHHHGQTKLASPIHYPESFMLRNTKGHDTTIHYTTTIASPGHKKNMSCTYRNLASH